MSNDLIPPANPNEGNIQNDDIIFPQGTELNSFNYVISASTATSIKWIQQYGDHTLSYNVIDASNTNLAIPKEGMESAKVYVLGGGVPNWADFSAWFLSIQGLTLIYVNPIPPLV